MNEDIDKMTFEESINTLEQMVKELENGGLDLDKSLEVYERAMVLRDHCKKILDESDRKVQKIMETAGTIKKEEFNIDPSKE